MLTGKCQKCGEEDIKISKEGPVKCKKCGIYLGKLCANMGADDNFYCDEHKHLGDHPKRVQGIWAI